MTVRERNLMFTLGGVAGAVVLVIVFMQWFWTPYQNAKRDIRELNDDVDKNTKQLADLKREQKRLEKYKVLSLSASDQAASEYTDKFLMPVLRGSGLTDIKLQAPPPGKFKAPAAQGKKAGHLPLDFVVGAHGDIGGVVQVLKALKNAPLAHRVKSLTLTTAETSTKDAGKLNLFMTIEALIVSKAPAANPFLASADTRVLAVDTAAVLGRAPAGLAVGLAIGPWFAFKENLRTEVAKEESAQRKYEDLKNRNLFAGAVPVVDLPERRPVDFPFDVREYIKLDHIGLTENEAYLRNNVVRERETKLRPKKPGFEYFVVWNEDRDLQLLKGKVLKLAQREMYFQVGEFVYAMHIGASLADAMRRALSDDEMEELQLTELYDEDFAQQQTKQDPKKGSAKGGAKAKTKTRTKN